MKYVVTIGYKRFEGFKCGDTALRFAEIARETIVDEDNINNDVTVEVIKEEE